MSKKVTIDNPSITSSIDKELAIFNALSQTQDSKRKRILLKIIDTAAGSLPWIGTILGAISDFKSEEEQIKNNNLYTAWLNEHRIKMTMLEETILNVLKRLNEFSDEINDRLESEEYLLIVRKSFKVWDNVETNEKRELVRKLLINASSNKIVQDDIIRLFLDWIEEYHEVHFSIIKHIRNNDGATRGDVWRALNGAIASEKSTEAGLYQLLFRQLSLGGLIIQKKKSTSIYGGAKRQTKKKKSAFDNNDRYELTSLGNTFIHYAMDEVVDKIENQG